MSFAVTFANGPSLAVLAVVFLLVFLFSLEALREMLAPNGHYIMASLCVAILSALGVASLVLPCGTAFLADFHGQSAGWVSPILLPYQALALTLVFLPIVLGITSCIEHWLHRNSKSTENDEPNRQRKPGLSRRDVAYSRDRREGSHFGTRSRAYD